MKILPSMFGGALALAVVLLGGVPAASAATSAPAEADETVQACWYDVITLQEACAATQEELAELVYVDYGVEFVDQDIPDALVLTSVEKQALTSSQRSAAADTVSPNAVNATFILGIYYTSTNYAGASRTMTANLSSAPCAAPGNYVYGNVPGLSQTTGGFNDNIESIKGYGMCGLKLYADNDYAGSSFGPSAAASTLGAFNNQASSIRVFKTS